MGLPLPKETEHRSTQVPADVRLVDLRDGTAEDRVAVAFLHAAMVPHSPIVQLGREFMEDYYYNELIADGLIGSVVAYVNDKPAGFIAYTRRPQDFMVTGMRRHLFALVPVVGRAVLARPKRMRFVARALGILKRRRDQITIGPPYDSEVISFAVMPQYRTPAFVAANDMHLGHELFGRAIEMMRDAGARKLAMLVEARDRETQLFLHEYGCSFTREWTDGVDCYVATHPLVSEAGPTPV